MAAPKNEKCVSCNYNVICMVNYGSRNCKYPKKIKNPTSEVKSLCESIRQTIQAEIESLDRAIERFVSIEAMEAAAYTAAERNGLVRILSVLATKHGICD